ncbi:MAG: shikimate kinase [Alphaproteobacteria bacterium]|nr:shikimate kinase [Alphaproteobacteria bacterium]
MTATDKTNGKPIVLVGMMGAGKTLIGKKLAGKVRRTFIDVDETIETQTQQTIAELFATQGEPGFRAIEQKTIATLLSLSSTTAVPGRAELSPVAEAPSALPPLFVPAYLRPRHVIALGGGAFETPDTRRLCLSHAFCIWLDADLDLLWSRVAESNKRPLVDKKDKAAFLRRAQQRQPNYAQCHAHIYQTTEHNSKETLAAILAALAL